MICRRTLNPTSAIASASASALARAVALTSTREAGASGGTTSMTFSTWWMITPPSAAGGSPGSPLTATSTLASALERLSTDGLVACACPLWPAKSSGSSTGGPTSGASIGCATSRGTTISW